MYLRVLILFYYNFQVYFFALMQYEFGCGNGHVGVGYLAFVYRNAALFDESARFTLGFGNACRYHRVYDGGYVRYFLGQKPLSRG